MTIAIGNASFILKCIEACVSDEETSMKKEFHTLDCT